MEAKAEPDSTVMKTEYVNHKIKAGQPKLGQRRWMENPHLFFDATRKNLIGQKKMEWGTMHQQPMTCPTPDLLTDDAFVRLQVRF